MNKIAIDVVLLPPENIMDLAIQINKTEAEKGNSKGELNKVDFFPHLSLAMGIIKKEDFDKVIEIVRKISNKYQPQKLKLQKPYYVEGKDGQKSYAIMISKGYLKKLHKDLMNQLNPFLSFDATSKEIYNQEEEPDYVNQYKKIGSFDKYNPHITLRCKEITQKIPKQIFVAKRLAICHIGISTTCRKILFETELKEVR